MQRNETEIRMDEIEQKLWNQKPRDTRLSLAHQMATKSRKLEPSDPFIYNRVFSRLMNGSGDPESFGYQIERGDMVTGDGRKVSLA